MCVQAGTSGMYMLTASQGCTGGISVWLFSLRCGMSNRRSVAVELSFLGGCLSARCCLMQSEVGLCRDPGQSQPWIPPEDQVGGLL